MGTVQSLYSIYSSALHPQWELFPVSYLGLPGSNFWKFITSHYIHHEKTGYPCHCEPDFHVLEDCYHILSKALLE